MNDEPKVGERYKLRNKLYQVELVGEMYVILTAVHGDRDDGMIISRADWGESGLKKVEQ